MRLTKTFAVAAASGLALAACAPTVTDDNVDIASDDAISVETAEGTDEVTEVAGAEMYADKTIVENAMNSPIHTTLVQAVQAAELVDTLSGTGPFTVFAPTDEAFSNSIPAETLQALLQPNAKTQLQQILSYHVVPGELDAEELMERIDNNGGEAVVATLEGSPLTFTEVNGNVAVTDERGGVGYVTQADVRQSNGVMHVLNNVLLPSMQAGG